MKDLHLGEDGIASLPSMSIALSQVVSWCYTSQNGHRDGSVSFLFFGKDPVQKVMAFLHFLHLLFKVSYIVKYWGLTSREKNYTSEIDYFFI